MQLPLRGDDVQEASGPPPRWSTGFGTPPGSGPTETTTAPRASGTTILSSLPGKPPTGTKLVARDEHVLGAEAARPDELTQDPRHRVRLVGQPDLDVLHVAGDAGAGKPVLARKALGDRERLAQPAHEARADEPRLHGAEQRRQRRLRRVAPLGDRDEIDLAAIEPVENDPDCKPSPAVDGGAHGFGNLGEPPILLGRGLASPREHGLAVRVERKHLGSAVGREIEAPLVWTADPRGELHLDVVSIGARDDDDGVAARSSRSSAARMADASSWRSITAVPSQSRTTMRNGARGRSRVGARQRSSDRRTRQLVRCDCA